MPGKKKPSPVATATVDLGSADLSLKLRQSEVDRANVKYLLSPEKDLDTLNGHPLFVEMVNEEPRTITNSAEDTGFQSVFDAQLYQTTVKCLKHLHRRREPVLGRLALVGNARRTLAPAIGG